MRYMAGKTAMWKDDSGRYVKVVAGVTIVESERKLDNDRFPFFHRAEEEKPARAARKASARREVEEID